MAGVEQHHQQQEQEQQEEAKAGGGALHIVVFPWLAFGHLIPFMELSKRLAARGHAVTFVSTPRNAARLPPVPAAGRVRTVALPLPAVEGLPDGAESTADVPPDKVELLKTAFDGLAAPFADFLAAAGGPRRGEEHEHELAVAAAFARRPDWIVADFAHFWLPPIADQHKVACAMFQIGTATMVAYFGPRQQNADHPRVTVDDFMPMPPWFPLPPPPSPPPPASSSSLAFRRHEAAWIAGAMQRNASGVADSERFWRTVQRCRLLLVRSCPEVEPAGVFPLLAELYRKPVLPAGLLLPEDDVRRDDDDDNGGALRWLDAQPAGSVLYVALGSEAPVTPAGARELALGLELSGARFLWALRLPSGAPELLLLPEGFEARTRGRGEVRTGWVPQTRVLAHAAVGAFLTHCGWGSVVESLRFGHPLVMLPFVVDQGLIARIMAARGVGVEVARRDDGDDGSFGRDDVAEAVRRVMVAEEEGKRMFALSARKLRDEVLGVGGDDGRQERYVDEVVNFLQRHRFTE